MDQKNKAMIFLLFTTSFWAGNFVVGKIVVASVPPFIMSFSRWLIALSILIPLLYKKGWFDFSILKKYWLYFLLMALSGVFGFNSLVYFAVKYTTSVNATIVNALNPVVIVILSGIFLQEKMGFKQIFGILLSFIGVMIVISHGTLDTFKNFTFNTGDILMIFAVFLWAIYSILMKKVTAHISSLAATTISAIIGFLLLIPFAIFELYTVEHITFNMSSIIGLLYIGVFASVLAFLGWNEGVIRLGAGKASVFMNLIPFFAAIFSFVFLKEHLAYHQILGGLVVIVGVFVTNVNNLMKKYRKTTVKQANV